MKNKTGRRGKIEKHLEKRKEKKRRRTEERRLSREGGKEEKTEEEKEKWQPTPAKGRVDACESGQDEGPHQKGGK